ncbi:MAG TPA: CxxC-x17-CxxC domain-containing protein [Oculatellaceae cyanobacterium]|jgi:CxxC-x17-CxxC domain-containing protein
MDKDITCGLCGTVFVFTAEEQEFYHSKGFNEPRKCKPCRDAAKQNRGGYGGGGYGRPQRQMHDAVCSGCGVQTQVPFMPTGAKPVYCRDCFQSARA